MPRRQSRTGCERCGRAVRKPRYLARMLVLQTVEELGATGAGCALTAAGTPLFTHVIRVWQSLSTALDEAHAMARTTRGVFSASPALENWTKENFRKEAPAQRMVAAMFALWCNSKHAQVAAARSKYAERLGGTTESQEEKPRSAKHAEG